MLANYESLIRISQAEFPDVVTRAIYIGGTSSSPNKLRLILVDGSFMDIWLSAEGDYAYHWERRRQTGQMYRWDNAPHHPTISTFPAHFHDGDEATIQESSLSAAPSIAVRAILEFIRIQLN
ncbi:MAG TPA: DUF6516 family protein [Anaerolineae bacterium]|nr:DUF6516 family protein [Anaerolineae bacterium]